MHDPLVHPNEFFLWRRIVAAIGVGLVTALVAFVATWVVLAWPTIHQSMKLFRAGGSFAPPQSVETATPTFAPNRLSVPRIDVEAPVFYDTEHADAVGQLPNGVVHARDTAHPGQTGNVFLVGHSAGYWWQRGEFNQVFALLGHLKIGDAVYISDGAETYEYRVREMSVVAPNQVEVMDQPTDRKFLTLMTCTPVGTTLNRLIVRAELVHRRAAGAETSQEFIERLMDARGPAN